MLEELKIYKDIEITFIRLRKPDFNSLDLPLSGLYNSIDNIEYSNYPLKNKFKNFSFPSPGQIGVDNLFQLKNSFGKLYTEEILEGIIIIANISERDITIKNMEISLFFEKHQKTMAIPLPDKDSTLFLSKSQSYLIKFKNYLKKSGKYSLDVKFWTKCDFYDQQYYITSQRNRIKYSDKYKIIGNHVEYYNNIIFNFSVHDPFEIKPIFKVNQMKEEFFIEINIKNKSTYNLTIPDLIIKPKQRNNLFLKPVTTLEELQLNIDDSNDTKSNINNLLQNSKIFTLQPEEELNILFKSQSKEIFLLEEKFIIYIKWLKILDFLPKNFEYEFNNELDIFNQYFYFMAIERPKGNIILGQNFPVIFQFVNKQPNLNLSLTISEHNENKNENEIDIQIKEYQFELNNLNQKYDVNIICKSEKIGIVKFPKIIIKMINNIGNKEEYIYKDLLCFNCVENVQLI